MCHGCMALAHVSDLLLAQPCNVPCKTHMCSTLHAQGFDTDIVNTDIVTNQLLPAECSMPVVTRQLEMNIASSLWVACLHSTRYKSKAAKKTEKMHTQTEAIQQVLLSTQHDRSSYIMIRLHFAQVAKLQHAELACHCCFPPLITFLDLCPFSHAVSASLLCQDKTSSTWDPLIQAVRLLTLLPLVLLLPLPATTAVTAVDALGVDHCRLGECSWRGLSSPTSGSGALMTHHSSFTTFHCWNGTQLSLLLQQVCTTCICNAVLQTKLQTRHLLLLAIAKPWYRGFSAAGLQSKHC